jgi:hypothetical protein
MEIRLRQIATVLFCGSLLAVTTTTMKVLIVHAQSPLPVSSIRFVGIKFVHFKGNNGISITAKSLGREFASRISMVMAGRTLTS